MGTMPVNKLLITMSVPMVISMLVQALYNIVDSIFVAQISENALTAVSLAFPAQNLMIGVAIGTCVGVNALVSRHLGEKDRNGANRIANNGIFLSFMTFVAFFILGLFFSEIFYRFQTKNEEIIREGTSYLKICTMCSFGIFGQFIFEKLLQATGRTFYSMIAQGVGAITNIILDPIFIFGLHMGVSGAALATVISQIASAIWVLLFLTGKKALLTIKRKNLKLDLSLVKDIAGLGTAGFIVQATNSLVQIVCNVTLQNFGGDLYVGVMTVLNSVREILGLPVSGITSGAQPVLGYNYGAKRNDRVKEGIRFTALIGTIYTIVAWFVIMIIPKFLFQIFTSDPAVIEKGPRALNIYFFGFFFMSFQFAGQTVFQALGKAKEAVFFSLLRKVFIVVPLTLLLPYIGFGVHGVFLAEPISNAIGGLACFIAMWVTVYKKL